MRICFASAVAMLAAAANAQQLQVPVAKAEIRLDGKLDEDAWKAAAGIADLTQAAPRPGESTPYKTEVRLLIADEALYVGVRCADPDPSGIKAGALVRDGDMGGDDTVAVALDTFLDGRTGYYFRANAAGAIQDGLISGGEEMSLSWDGDWQARSFRDQHGWSCEFRIPVSSLRYKAGSDVWGFNVERYVARDRARLRWSGISLNYNVHEMSQAGRIGGFKALGRPPRLATTPYFLADFTQNHADDREVASGKTGLDVRYDLTSELSGVLTVATDFAETEADGRQLNLDRFPLFFPEKRRFFMEGSNQFEFGLGLDSEFLPFYSRRIGLFQGHQVPLETGLKLIGRLGPVGIGALATRMGSNGGAESTTLGVGRFTYDVDDKLRVGTIATAGSPGGVAENRLIGFDGLWRTTQFQGDKNLLFGAWWARTDGNVPKGRRDGWGFKLDYPNDLWDVSVRWAEYGEALNPSLGFLPRPGQRSINFGGAYQPRPKAGPIRQWFFETFYREWQTPEGTTVSKRLFTAPVNFSTHQGDRYEFNVAPQYELVLEGFEIAPGVTVPAGSYEFTRYRVEAESSESRPFFVSETIWFGGYFGGTLTQWEHQMGWTPRGSKLKLAFGSEVNRGDLPGGSFINTLYETRVDFAFSPTRTLSALAQYDSESRDLGMNLRYRWQIAPGSDLFVVWNGSWLREEGGARRLRPQANQLAIKLALTYRS